ncbi:MAG: HisA/HisF-related TIM barrel protein [Halobacteriota archaeon]|nr:HisA/HisF-related TIM barrel protein [Halobacteriota archaeon]
MFRTIFVIDLHDGYVVHALKGDREKYKQIHHFSRLVNTSEPIEIIDSLQPDEIYIADLNRLNEDGDNREVIEELSRSCKVMLDWGVKSIEDLKDAPKLVEGNIIVGTETSSIELIKEASEYGITVSLDIKDGNLISQSKRHDCSPIDFVKRLNEADLVDLIILNMSSIGTKDGIDIEFLKKIREASKHNLILGGGIKEAGELKELEKIGFSGALVATAIHDKSIPLEILRRN